MPEHKEHMENSAPQTLLQLGWQPFFQQQLNLEEWGVLIPARIVEQHKSQLEVASEQGRQTLPLTHATPTVTVGDWLLLDGDNELVRVLDRQSCFRRKAAGSQLTEQLIAANVDTAFIVCSLNDDFNLNRLERYLSMVHNADVEPVVVLTKMDLCEEAEALRSEVQSLDSLMMVEMVNSLNEDSKSMLMPWCQPGKTVVMLGSSGAGKSTLVNLLLGEAAQSTASIREEDSKGRHTTTRRSLLSMPDGAILLDTPGMRELQLTDCEHGVAATFADIEELTERCRFGDCQHHSEPGCAVQAAIEKEDLDERRFLNYEKLMREQAMNSASLAEKRATDKKLGRFYKRVIGESVKAKRGSE